MSTALLRSANLWYAATSIVSGDIFGFSQSAMNAYTIDGQGAFLRYSHAWCPDLTKWVEQFFRLCFLERPHAVDYFHIAHVYLCL